MCARRSGGASTRRKARAPGASNEEKLGHRGGGGRHREKGGAVGRHAFTWREWRKKGKGAWQCLRRGVLSAWPRYRLRWQRHSQRGTTQVRGHSTRLRLGVQRVQECAPGRGVAKAQKARAAEVALAIEHAWLGEAREDLEEDVVYSPANEAQTRKAKAKRLKGQAEELADKIDALSYSAILGDKGNNQPDKAEDKSNVLFGKIAGSGAKQGFADAQSGAALSNDMMWLCNVAGATATDYETV
ncbi:hypothetical protein ERJ75_001121200 [Trypanosoma vivax]|nr:hypothetical protein ERJ75_001121200 [Trypanosoma vivax]